MTIVLRDDERHALRLVCEDGRAFVSNVTRRYATETFVHNGVAVRLADLGLVALDGAIVEPTDHGRDVLADLALREAAAGKAGSDDA